MSNFAKGTHAKAMCDRCGHKVRYLSLHTEWNGRRVCPKCFEEKHPQLTPKQRLNEGVILNKPRPDRDDVSTTVTQLTTVVPATFGGGT